MGQFCCHHSYSWGKWSHAVATSIPLLAALFASVVIGSAAAILAWREGDKPGAKPLVLMLVAQSWWSISLIFRLQAETVGAKLFWMYAMWIGVITIPFGWLLFALDYTGRDSYLQPRYVGLAAIVPVLTVIVIVTSPFHDLLTIQFIGSAGSGVHLSETGGHWYWIAALYTYTLGVIGAIPLVELLASKLFTFRKQAGALLFAILAPWVTNILYLSNTTKWGIDPTPITFSVSGVVFLLALIRYDLLRTHPAPGRRARELVFNGVREGTIIVDMEGHIIDINDRALEFFGVSRQTVLGQNARSLLPNYDALPADGRHSDILSLEAENETREFELATTNIQDTHGGQIGRIITINEITRFLRQQQRLEVLNRVFRHNIRTETNLILGYAEEANEPNAERIRERASRIEAIGQNSREAIELFQLAREESKPRNIDTILRGEIEEARKEYPAVDFTYEDSTKNAKVASLLNSVFKHGIKNAAAHNTSDHPRVAAEATVTADSVKVRVSDNGPGIPDHELEVLSEGAESPLHHGSGLGLWIMKWGTDLADGTVEFEQTGAGGTVVRFEVPRME